jgi:hypothetical protein
LGGEKYKWENGRGESERERERERERETKRKLSRCKSSQFLAHYAICVFNKMTQKNFEDGLIQNTSKRVPT